MFLLKLLFNSNNNTNIKIELLSKQLLEKTWIKNLDKEKVNYLEKLLNKPKDNESNSLKEKKYNCRNESGFYSSSSDSWMLNITNIESFEIKASYENINEITSNKYIKNNALRNRTKEFLLKQCEYGNENEKNISGSKISSDFNYFKSLIYDKKNNIKNNGKIKKRESEKRINKITEINLRNTEKNKKYNTNRCSMPDFKFDNHINLKKPKILEKNKKFDISIKTLSNNLLPHLKKGKNMRLSVKINNKQEKLNRSFRLRDEKGMNFYDKYNISYISHLNQENSEEKPLPKKKRKHDSEFDEIKNIIKQDAQNLNQPALYYQKLFFNQIQKKKEYNKNINNLNIRRISTSKEAYRLNNKLGVSIKKNSQNLV